MQWIQHIVEITCGRDWAAILLVNARTSIILMTNAARALRRLSRIQRITVIGFYVSITGIFGGLAVGCAGLETLGSTGFVVGFLLLAALLGEAYLVFPFLRCPSCINPFFLPKGWVGVIHKVNPHNRTCVNCGLDLDADAVSDEG